MTKHAPDLDAERLLQLSKDVSRISATLAELSIGLDSQSPSSGPCIDQDIPEVSEETVRWIISARNSRFKFLPMDLFADPAWDILLELLRAEIAQQRVPVSNLCLASNAPATTALRYIKTMNRAGMIVREPDPFDGRRVYVSLKPEISLALRRYCIHVFEKPITKKVA